MQPSDFKLIATDFKDGLEFIDGSIPPSLSDDGFVAFTGTRRLTSTPGPQAIFVGFGGGLNIASTETAGFSNVTAVQLTARGDLNFIAERITGGTRVRGVYRTNPLGTTYRTILRAPVSWAPGSAGSPPPRPNILAASPNGTLGFSTLVDGAGGIYRLAPNENAELLRAGSGIFYNVGSRANELDVNDSGAVAVGMEYSDGRLSRGLLVFDKPGDDLGSIEATIIREDVGTRPFLAINGLGQMAFAINFPVTIPYFTPALSTSGPMTGSITLTEGVYLATPSAYGLPFAYTQIASTAAGYSDFGRLDVNDAGIVVFEARYRGESGVFSGPDPIAHRVAITGKEIVIGGENNFFSIVRLGHINNHGQVSIQTSDFRTADQKVWRVDRLR